jgi:hypothetical protein
MDNRPSTYYQPPFVTKFNRSTRLWNLFGQKKIDLSEASLIAAARAETGLERFGDESFLPPLRALLRSLETEAELNPFGRFNARMRTIRSLKNRLWANACFEAHPEILERPIEAPIVIVGPHRSGTTRLQRMMATDTRLQHLKTWEGFNPAPRPGLPDMGKQLRRDEVKQFLDLGRQIYTGGYIAHPMDADWPEEDMLLLNHSFCGFSVLGMFHIPGYYRWFLEYDKTEVYRYTAKLMKLISWSRGDEDGKRWVLKNPQHMLDLDVLMKVFPDARLVFTHRDPIKTVGSVMSLMWHFAVQHTDLPCRASTREVWMDFCEQAARRAMEQREHIVAAQQMDVHYEEMNRDWRAAMQRIYAFGGMEFTTPVEQAMHDWLDNSEKENLHGGHRYALEDFGTSAAEVDRRMTFVRERYAIAYEGK